MKSNVHSPPADAYMTTVSVCLMENLFMSFLNKDTNNNHLKDMSLTMAQVWQNIVISEYFVMGAVYSSEYCFQNVVV